MKIECEVRVKTPRAGKGTIDFVTVTLDGNFEAILELLTKINFNLDIAKELELQ